MMWDHVIKGGVIVTPDESVKGNIYIQNGKIAAISACELPGEAAMITDASGKYVLPGFIDTHVHSRDGQKGLPEKEDFFHSSMAAACGGVTTICEMPNCYPPVYNVDRLHELVDCIEPKAHVDFGVWGLCLGDLNSRDIEPMAEAGVIGFKFFWGYAIHSKTYQLIYNYRRDMQDVIPPLENGDVFRIFRDVAKTGRVMAVHAENFDLIRVLTEEVLASPDRNYAAMLRSRPAVSETTVISTAIDLAREAGAHLHILHVAAGADVEVIRRAQRDGQRVTAETCPHYLALTDRDAERVQAVMKTYPIIRTAADQEQIWDGLRDGTIGSVCSDHAPHLASEKAKGLWDAPAGISGVETSSLILLDAVNKGRLTLHDVARVFSENPAKMIGVYPRKGSLRVGADADIVVVDMDKSGVFHQSQMHSVVKMSPYDGITFQGKVVRTILRGRTIAADSEIVGRPSGAFIRPDDRL